MEELISLENFKKNILYDHSHNRSQKLNYNMVKDRMIMVGTYGFQIILHHIKFHLKNLSKNQILNCLNTHNAHSFISYLDLYSVLFMIVNVYKTQTIVMYLRSCFTCT